MNSYKTIISKENQKDKQKGQKILTALYLITDHLKDSEPLKTSVRECAVSFATASLYEKEHHALSLEVLLGGGVLLGLLSEKNASIIVYEINQYVRSLFLTHDESDSVETLFEKTTPPFQVRASTPLLGQNKTVFDKRQNNYQKDTTSKNVFYEKNVQKDTTEKSDKKEDRKRRILTLINDKKSVVIKDITTLFPDVSEKTIQRELTTLIDAGLITKRGNKRWSIYMAVQSLL